MAKYLHGELIILFWDEQVPFQAVKGAVSDAEFLAQVEKEFGADDLPDFERIEHSFGRWGVGVDESGEPGQKFYQYDESGRGRFPITVGWLSNENQRFVEDRGNNYER